MGDEKPFSCTAPGCGQRFTNEDHLAVHRHKHEMTLKLGPARSDSVIVADQTPTPTRFLKNCEEVGLFHELASPLEHDFRKGADEDPRKLPLDLSPLAGPVTRSKMEESSMAESPRLSPVPHPESTTGSDQEGPVVPPQPAAPRPISLHIPGVLLANSDTNAPASPAANSVLTPVPSPSRTIVPVSSSFPLLLQLPNGQTMPVALSASIANPAAHIPTALPLAGPVAVVPSLPGVPGPASPQPVQSEAKMVTSSEPVDAPSPTPPEELCAQSLQQPATSTTETAASPPPPARRISCTGGRRRRASNDDPDEKRRKFLERNRAAASRCRQKRKVWVQALEKKAEDLDSLNSLLQSEVTQLRTEVAQLKQLLVAHEDCPVTAMLRKSGCHSEGAASPSSSPPAEVIQHSSVSTSNGIGSSSGPLAGLEPVPSLQAAQPEVGLEPPAEAPPTQS